MIETSERFFDGYKKYSNKANKLEQTVLDLQVKLICQNPEIKMAVILSDKKDASLYFSNMDGFAAELSKSKKGIIFYNDKFVYGLLGDKTLINESELKEVLEEARKGDKPMKYNSKNSVKVNNSPVNNVLQFSAISSFKLQSLNDYFNRPGFSKI